MSSTLSAPPPLQITLTWDGPRDLGGAPVTCYRVDRALDGVADSPCALPTFSVEAGVWVSDLPGPSGPSSVTALDASTLAGPGFPPGLSARLVLAAAPTSGVYATTVVDCVPPLVLQGINGTGGPFLNATGATVTLRVNPTSVSRVWVRAVTTPPASRDVGATTTPAALVSAYSGTLVTVAPPGVPGAPPAPVLLSRNASHVGVGWGVTTATGGCALTRLLLYVAQVVNR
jgi:hypothetical protein